MRLDPDVALRLVRAVDEVLAHNDAPSRRALQQAVDAARINDDGNRDWLESMMMATDNPLTKTRLPRAGDFTTMTTVLPVRAGSYGS